ncbi:hypothetical protein GE061_018070 [Apolygus lucorum]|uniref:Uncharacterized protein n=1 Tax=Apolygus lucorum TaxID=248454 RepID=A0A8S9XE81_APOLU|nr:hypothetical protein GE061_018070 [Apolygus lucorum]
MHYTMDAVRSIDCFCGCAKKKLLIEQKKPKKKGKKGSVFRHYKQKNVGLFTGIENGGLKGVTRGEEPLQFVDGTADRRAQHALS